MLTFNHQVLREFEKLQQDRMQALTDNLASGQIGSYDHYRWTTGVIQGLRNALDDLNDAISICEGRKG
jgi:hypothetical protein